MYGAIIGDLAGSIYEYPESIDSKKGFINKRRRLEVLDKENIIDENLRKYINDYKDLIPTKPYFKSVFTPRLIKWAEGTRQNNSNSNDAAMRISPVGYLFDDECDIRCKSRQITKTSHNNAESLKGAEAIAMTIFMARKHRNLKTIKDFITKKYNYNLNYKFYDLVINNLYLSMCELSVKQALYIALSSKNFEDAIRKAIAIGGDTDTVGAVTGSIAEAIHGIPDEYKNIADSLLPNDFKQILDRGYAKIKKY